MTEKKYIELQKALNVCEMHYEHCLEMHDWSGDTTADNIKRDIKTLPTADVVPVVRCKYCKHYEFSTACCKHFCNEYGGFVTENDYCSRAEKSDGIIREV